MDDHEYTELVAEIKEDEAILLTGVVRIINQQGALIMGSKETPWRRP